MRRPTALFITTIICLGSFTGCSTDRTDAAESRALPEIPDLKSRGEGLDVGDFSKVKRQYDANRRKLEADPSDVDGMVGLAQVFMYEARVSGDHPYYYPAALTMLDRALAVNPEEYEAVIAKASVLLSLHKFAEARLLAERAARIAPNAAAPYGALVDANVELGDLEAAVKAADRMMEIRPDLKSYARVSYLRELHGDIDGAIEAMDLAVDAGAPGSEEKAWARKTLGDIYFSVNRLKEAKAEYQMTVAERKDYPFALAGLARVAWAEGNEEEALSILDHAMGLLPEFSFAQLQADIHRAAGRDREADSLITMISAMLAEDEASGHSMNLELARLYASHDVNQAEAVERARDEVAERPSSPEALDVLSWALFRAGELEEAESTSEKARTAAPTNGVILAHNALIDITLGNRAEGERELKRAMKLQPRMPILLEQTIRKVMP